MQDLLYVAMICALIAIGALFVIGCDKIVGPDDSELAQESDAALASERQREKVAR